MSDTAFILSFLLFILAAFLLVLYQTRRIRWLEHRVKTQGRTLDKVFNCYDRLTMRVSAIEDAEEQRKKREEELSEAEAQIQKAQEVEKLWQSGMEHIQAYDYDAARKAVTGSAGE